MTAVADRTRPISPLWRTMDDAPKDRPILALLSHADCGGGLCAGNNLCLYHAHGETLTYASDGPAIIWWGGSYEDCADDGGAFMPDWWFLCDLDWETAANPIAWCEIPAYA